MHAAHKINTPYYNACLLTKTWTHSFIPILQMCSTFRSRNCQQNKNWGAENRLISFEFKEMSQHTQLPNWITVTLTVSEIPFFFCSHVQHNWKSVSFYICDFGLAWHSQSIKDLMPYLSSLKNHTVCVLKQFWIESQCIFCKLFDCFLEMQQPQQWMLPVCQVLRVTEQLQELWKF